MVNFKYKLNKNSHFIGHYKWWTCYSNEAKKKITQSVEIFNKWKFFFRNLILISVTKKQKNVFLNISRLFSGENISKASCGFFNKTSLKKNFFGTDHLLKRVKIEIKKEKFKNFIFLNIKGFLFHKGFKRALLPFLYRLKKEYRIVKINNINFIAHNGVKAKARRRK